MECRVFIHCQKEKDENIQNGASAIRRDIVSTIAATPYRSPAVFSAFIPSDC